MPDVYPDVPNRVIVRHQGPAGRGFPSGGTTGQILAKTSGDNYDATWVNPPDGTDAVNGPASASNNNVAVFDGATGKLLKDGGQPLSNYATVSALGAKQDKETGKGLSEENFTTVLKAKLDALSPASFRGVFSSLSAINAYTFDPVPQSGDYCTIESVGVDPEIVLWDETNSLWVQLFPDAVDMTGAEIAAVLFDTDDTWDQDDCRIFTEAYRTKVDQHQTFVESVGGLVVAPVQGNISYFSLTGSVIAIAAASDGTTNLVKIDVPSTVSADAQSFDNGGASNGRLRYTGSTARRFWVDAKVSLGGPASDVFVLGVAKNGSLLPSSRILEANKSTGTVSEVSITCIVELSLNDYVEVFIGNTTDADDPTIYVLSIDAAVI